MTAKVLRDTRQVRSGNDFVIALTYGSQADWVKNVLASGRATIEHGGIDHAVSNPRIVGRSDALGVFPAWAVAILRLVAVTEFSRLEVET